MALLIQNGLVMPSTHSEPRSLDILVDASLISGVGHRLPVPPGKTILDASVHIVIPGLINAHTHGGSSDASSWRWRLR